MPTSFSKASHTISKSFSKNLETLDDCGEGVCSIVSI